MWPVVAAMVVTDPSGEVVLQHEGPLPLERVVASVDGRSGLMVWVAAAGEVGQVVEVDLGPLRDGEVRTKRREAHMASELGEIVAARPRWRGGTWDVRVVVGRVGSIEGPRCDAPLVEHGFDDGTGWRAPEGAPPALGGLEVSAGERPADAIGRVGDGWARWTEDGPAPVIAISSVGDPRVTLSVGCLEVTAATSVPTAGALVAREE